MTKMSARRGQRRQIRKLAEREAAKLTPAEARRKLAEWAAAGGDMGALRSGQLKLPAAPSISSIKDRYQ